MKVRDIMTPNVQLTSPDNTIRDAAERMKELDIGALPVGENNTLVGIVTDRDIALRATAEGRNPASTPVRDVMSRDIFYCYEDQPLNQAADVMKQKKVRRLVVLDNDKRMVGIFSLGDLILESGRIQLGADVLKRVSESN